MKRDMDLVRLILLKVEEEHKSEMLIHIAIPGYSKETVAYHCKILKDANLLSDYRAVYSDNTYSHIDYFMVGPMTWEGNDYLDKVRDDSLWRKTKEAIEKKGLPLIFDTIKTVANAFITAAAEGIANSIIKNGGA